jgi:muramidase (phage lysozyme)
LKELALATVGGNKNVLAFLDMLAFSEGTVKFGDQNGYNVIVGGSLFTDYSDHPNRIVHITPELNSTAAGRYQLLHRFWPPYRDELRLPDFSPRSQDLVAIQQIKECRAIPTIMEGDLYDAIHLCAHIWASLPGAGYKGQREQKLSDLKAAYVAAGGLFTPQPQT